MIVSYLKERIDIIVFYQESLFRRIGGYYDLFRRRGISGMHSG